MEALREPLALVVKDNTSGWEPSGPSTLQVELLDRQPWQTRAQLTTAIFEYTEVLFNRQRLYRALGYVSPTEYEEMVAFRRAA